MTSVAAPDFQVWPDGDDLRPLDQHVARRELTDGRVHRHDVAAADEVAAPSLAMVLGRVGRRGRGAQQADARRRRGRRGGGDLQEVAPRPLDRRPMLLGLSCLAELAHGRPPLGCTSDHPRSGPTARIGPSSRDVASAHCSRMAAQEAPDGGPAAPELDRRRALRRHDVLLHPGADAEHRPEPDAAPGVDGQDRSHHLRGHPPQPLEHQRRAGDDDPAHLRLAGGHVRLRPELVDLHRGRRVHLLRPLPALHVGRLRRAGEVDAGAPEQEPGDPRGRHVPQQRSLGGRRPPDGRDPAHARLPRGQALLLDHQRAAPVRRRRHHPGQLLSERA